MLKKLRSVLKDMQSYNTYGPKYGIYIVFLKLTFKMQLTQPNPFIIV